MITPVVYLERSSYEVMLADELTAEYWVAHESGSTDICGTVVRFMHLNDPTLNFCSVLTTVDPDGAETQTLGEAAAVIWRSNMKLARLSKLLGTRLSPNVFPMFDYSVRSIQT